MAGYYVNKIVYIKRLFKIIIRSRFHNVPPDLFRTVACYRCNPNVRVALLDQSAYLESVYPGKKNIQYHNIRLKALHYLSGQETVGRSLDPDIFISPVQGLGNDLKERFVIIYNQHPDLPQTLKCGRDGHIVRCKIFQQVAFPYTPVPSNSQMPPDLSAIHPSCHCKLINAKNLTDFKRSEYSVFHPALNVNNVGYVYYLVLVTV